MNIMIPQVAVLYVQLSIPSATPALMHQHVLSATLDITPMAEIAGLAAIFLDA